MPSILSSSSSSFSALVRATSQALRPGTIARALSLAIALAAPLLTESVAEASPSEDYAEGLRLYSNKEFTAAAEALARSYKAKEDQNTLFAWAQAERLQGNCDASGKLFSEFIAKGANKKQSRAAFELMQDCVEQQPKTVEKPDTGSTGEENPEANPTPEVEPLLGADNSTKNNTSGQDLAVVTAGPTGQRSPWYSDWVGMSLVGSGTAALIVGGISYKSALDAEDDANGKGEAHFIDSKRLANDRRSLAVVAGVTGGVLLGGGIIYYLLRDGSSEEQNPISMQVDGTSTTFSYAGHF